MGFYKMRYVCNKCGERWNTAFVSVTPMQLARTQCPNKGCLSHDTTKVANDWGEEGREPLTWD